MTAPGRTIEKNLKGPGLVSGQLAGPVLLAFAGATMIWGSTWLVIRDQLGVVPPPWSVTYRFAVASTTMFLWARISRTPLQLDRSGHVLAMLFALPQFVINFNLVYLAERYVTSGLVAVVFALLIIPNSLLGWLVLGHRLNGRFVLGSIIAMAGVGLLFIHELRHGNAGPKRVFVGIGLSLLGMLFVSSANLLQATGAMRRRTLAAVLAWGMLYGTVANAILALLFAGPPVTETRMGYWLGVIYLGAMASAVAFTLYFKVIREIGPARAAYSGVIVPLLAMALSTVFEGYRWSTAAIAGGLLTLIGLITALSRSRSPLPAPDAA